MKALFIIAVLALLFSACSKDRWVIPAPDYRVVGGRVFYPDTTIVEQDTVWLN